MRLDALFTNGRFTTMDPARPTAQALGVLGGLIAGFDEELQGCRAEVVHDLGGAAVIPGLHDAHYHLSALGQSLQALRAYTYGSAYADHQEHRKGSLSRSKLADFVVLSEDLFAVAPAAIEQLSLAATVVGGVVRYGAEHLRSI